MSINNLDNAVEDIIAKNNDKVNFIIGSFYIYGDVIKKINEINEKNSN